MAGHFKAAGVEPMRYLREVRVENGEEHKTGDVVTVADFAEVKAVDVIGTSKGKGFQGTVKRWNFSRGPMTHGSRNQRRPGSIGQSASTPSRTSCSSRALSPAARTLSSRSAWPKCQENS